MSGRINWSIIGPDTNGYTYTLGKYAIWMHMQKFMIGFRIVSYSHEVTDIEVSVTPGEAISIYDSTKCNTVEQAMQVCEDELSELFRDAQSIGRDLIAALDDLIHEVSNNPDIDDDSEIQQLVSKRAIWVKELNELEKNIRKDK